MPGIPIEDKQQVFSFFVCNEYIHSVNEVKNQILRSRKAQSMLNTFQQWQQW